MRYLKILIMALLATVLTSCAVGMVDTTGIGDEDNCTVYYYSFLKNIDTPTLDACGVKAGATFSEVKEVDPGVLKVVIDALKKAKGM